MLFQFLPRLSDDEYAALEKSIREHGVQVPIVVDENDSVVDGHHRKEIAERLGAQCPRRSAMGLDEAQKRTLALSLNLDRRHMTREQKREVLTKSLTADPELSDREHAKRVGVAHTTVGRVRSELEATGALHQSDTRLSADGRQRPATQPDHVNTKAGEVADDYEDDDFDYVPDGPGGSVGPGNAGSRTCECGFTLAWPQDSTDDDKATMLQLFREHETDCPETTSTEAVAVADDVEEAPAGEVEPSLSPAPSRPAVTGIDGKTYTHAESKKPRRRPLTDQARDAGWDLRKSVERLQRIAADDRFDPQKDQMAPHLRGHLTNAIEVCQDVLDRINEQEESTK